MRVTAEWGTAPEKPNDPATVQRALCAGRGAEEAGVRVKANDGAPAGPGEAGVLTQNSSKKAAQQRRTLPTRV